MTDLAITAPKSCLALDLATATGYAYNDIREAVPTSNRFLAGTIRLQEPDEITKARRLRMDRRCDVRVIRLFDWLRGLPFEPDIVVFEDVQFQSYTQQCQLWSSLRAAVWLAFNHAPINIECVPVATLKKFATGHGGATKQMMCDALWRQYPDRFGPSQKKESVWDFFGMAAGPSGSPQRLDDNAVDAIWLWLWARINLMRTP